MYEYFECLLDRDDFKTSVKVGFEPFHEFNFKGNQVLWYDGCLRQKMMITDSVVYVCACMCVCMCI